LITAGPFLSKNANKPPWMFQPFDRDGAILLTNPKNIAEFSMNAEGVEDLKEHFYAITKLKGEVETRGGICLITSMTTTTDWALDVQQHDVGTTARGNITFAVQETDGVVDTGFWGTWDGTIGKMGPRRKGRLCLITKPPFPLNHWIGANTSEDTPDRGSAVVIRRWKALARSQVTGRSKHAITFQSADPNNYSHDGRGQGSGPRDSEGRNQEPGTSQPPTGSASGHTRTYYPLNLQFIDKHNTDFVKVQKIQVITSLNVRPFFLDLIPRQQQEHDPLDLLLHYMLEQDPSAEFAIAHDHDLIELLKVRCVSYSLPLLSKSSHPI
jgi:hypothetical protein